MSANPVLPEAPASDWLRRYPPVVVALIGILLAVLYLPSALNLPQTNPTETAEYAPIPPQDKNQAPPGGSIGNLGLGESSSVADQVSQDQNPDQPASAGAGQADTSSGITRFASRKSCVGNPPRQDEDPFSPPCVADFEGDNFGSTYTGVTGSEVIVLFYFNGNGGVIQPGVEGTRPTDKYYDLGQPAPTNPNDPNYESAGTSSTYPPVLRAYQKYFNDHYQTYNRFVHFWVYFGHVGDRVRDGSTDASPTLREQDALANYQKLHPFAVVNFSEENNESYTQVMASNHVVVFSGQGSAPQVGKQQSFLSQYPGQIWTFRPSMESFAAMSTTFICQKIIQPGKVTFSGDTIGDVRNGTPRKYGMIRVSEKANHPELITFASMVKKATDASQGGCGANYIVADSTYDRCCYDIATTNQADNATRQQEMVRFKNAGVTTIIWPGGIEPLYTKAATKIGYFPEWVLVGDGEADGNTDAEAQDQNQEPHAWTVSTTNYQVNTFQEYCYKAAADADPGVALNNNYIACKVYFDIREMFIGIQVAGPRLTPQSIDRGYHAIPHVQSNDPRTPSCFYDTGDYTCIKDAVAEWYNANAVDPNNNTGSWMMTQGGKRYLANQWPNPGQDVQALKGPNDFPNGFEIQ